jgi:hypothetical protein
MYNIQKQNIFIEVGKKVGKIIPVQAVEALRFARG